MNTKLNAVVLCLALLCSIKAFSAEENVCHIKSKLLVHQIDATHAEAEMWFSAICDDGQRDIQVSRRANFDKSKVQEGAVFVMLMADEVARKAQAAGHADVTAKDLLEHTTIEKVTYLPLGPDEL